jgi:hypothetical protein
MFLVLTTSALAGQPAATPAFDRPGISFSTSTLPAGTFAWEQGLPDFNYDSGGGSRSLLLSADANFRVGLMDHLELQVALPWWNELSEKSGGVRNHENGAGDVGLSLKAELPSTCDKLSWAVLGGATFETGSQAFTAGGTEVDVGVTVSDQLSDELSASAYVNFDRLNGVSTWTFSPAISYALNDKLGVFLEAGVDLAEGSSADTVVGGGVTYMISAKVQLDFSLDFGVGGHAPDVSGGVGFSVFFN